MAEKDSEERRFSFLKKRMKTPKISRQELQQNFARKGWNALSTFEAQSVDESEYQILSSPSKIYLTSKMPENSSKRKSMLIEIDDIESAFKENKLKTIKDCNSNPQTFHKFVQMLYKDNLCNKIHRKRLNSGSFTILEMQELFPTKKAHFENHHISNDFSDFSSKPKPFTVNGKQSNYVLQPSSTNQNKFQDFSKSFNSTSKKCINENFELDILIHNESSPVNENNKSGLKKINNRCFNAKNKFKNLSETFDCDPTNTCIKINSDDIPRMEYDTRICSKKECTKRVIPLNNTVRNKLKNLNSNCASHSANEKFGKANSMNEILINLESNPGNTNMPTDDLQSAHLSNFENNVNNEETLNITSSHKADIKVYRNKTFVQILQSSSQKKSLADKGSSWVQSLHWADVNESKDISSGNIDQVGKKGLKNIIPGGFAEQMLKLQRKERSYKVIWNHKMNELKKKSGTTFIALTLASVLHLGDNIITMCRLHDSSKLNIKDILCDINLNAQALDSKLSVLQTCTISSCDNLLQSTDSKQLIVLFKKSTFSKLQLKTKDVFVIYPPWQIILVPSLPAPVILCTYFVDLLHKSQEVVHGETLVHQPQSFYTGVHYSLQAKETKNDHFVFNDNIFISDIYDKNICISARIQRIWKNNILCEKVRDIFKIEKYLCFSLLLQTENGIFLELKICPDSLSHALLDFLSNAEGHCFKFYDLRVSHRYNFEKSAQFLKLLKIIQNQSTSNSNLGSSQMFCYSLIPSSLIKMPDEISDENFPHYCSFEVKPLSFLQTGDFKGIRFSCIGKVLFKDKEDVYISDESLMGSKIEKYYKLKFASPFKLMEQPIGASAVFIKEAVFTGDYIFIDQYSCIQFLSNSKISKMLLPYQSRLQRIALVTIEHFLTSLSLYSKVQEFVILTGTIAHVDENGAVSWLECSFCSRENLLEDSKSLIFCEDCSCVVPKPILKVRMEVEIKFSLPNAKIKVQLLSSTIKKILKISEDDFQPQCNIADVLNKSIGIICCCVKDIETISSQKVFKLKEICSY